MKNYYKCTPEQDKVILTYITMFPHNLDKGFELASIELAIDHSIIRDRWYGTLRKKDSVFMTGNPTIAYRNTKNVWRKKPRPEYIVKDTVKTLSGTITLKRTISTLKKDKS